MESRMDRSGFSSERDFLSELSGNVDPVQVLQTEAISLLKEGKYVVAYTGAGISTAANVADFTRPGIPKENDLDVIMPTYSHMALVRLMEAGILKFVVTSNHDNLHVKSGIPRTHIAELFGNAYVEKCKGCKIQFFRHTQVPNLGRKCESCGGSLFRTGVRYGQAVPQEPVAAASLHTDKADVALILGSSMGTSPFCDFPPKVKFSIHVNKSQTSFDANCTYKIKDDCDAFMRAVIKSCHLNIGTFEYRQQYKVSFISDPQTKFQSCSLLWWLSQ